LGIELKFVVDGMLGSFTRWLRILGYEAEYFKDASDDFLLEKTASQKAILLTGDVELFRRASTRGLFASIVNGEDEAQRLASVANRWGLRLDFDEVLSRCPNCGTALKIVNIEEVRDKVPAGTLKRYEEFWVCTCCGKVYWRGRHWKRINETLARARILLHQS
jgi:uncharacterized protein with PIN domain